jgi:hypothetical protein
MFLRSSEWLCGGVLCFWMALRGSKSPIQICNSYRRAIHQKRIEQISQVHIKYDKKRHLLEKHTVFRINLARKFQIRSISNFLTPEKEWPSVETFIPSYNENRDANNIKLVKLYFDLQQILTRNGLLHQETNKLNFVPTETNLFQQKPICFKCFVIKPQETFRWFQSICSRKWFLPQEISKDNTQYANMEQEYEIILSNKHYSSTSNREFFYCQFLMTYSYELVIKSYL